MPTLHIEHRVPSFDGWKKAFDADPVGRAKSGVRRYVISRAVDDPDYVTIDLEFDSVAEAEGLLAAMQAIWPRVEGDLVSRPRARIVEPVETRTY